MAAILDRARSFLPALPCSSLLVPDANTGGTRSGGTSGGGGGGAAVSLVTGAASGGGGGGASVRVGLRPYALGGLPAIGPVQGLPGVFVAAGHEGSGLSLAPATAELVLRHLGVADAPDSEQPGGDTPMLAAEVAGAAAEALLPVYRLAAAAAE